MLHEEITKSAIESFYTVYNTLGWGFLESVYQNAMIIELEKSGNVVEKEKNIEVYYDGQKVGHFFADIIVDDKVILELKKSERLNEENKYQLINYLKATNIEVGLLLNFGKSPEFKRVIFSNGKDRVSKTDPSNPPPSK